MTAPDDGGLDGALDGALDGVLDGVDGEVSALLEPLSVLGVLGIGCSVLRKKGPPQHMFIYTWWADPAITS